jgi:MFS transporter, SET family, sugar efflux transporter
MTASAPSDRVLWPVSAWFWALQFSVLNPLLAVLLVSLYGATATEVGLALGAYNVGGFVASLLIPAAADRNRDYLRPLLISAVCGLVMVGVLVATTSLPIAILTLVLLGGPPGVGSTLLFAQLRHTGGSPARVIRTRAIVSSAWVIGPPLAAGVVGVFTDRSALVLLALIAAVNVVTALLLLRHRARTVAPVQAGIRRVPLLQQLTGWSTWAVVGAFVLLQTTNIATVTVAGLFVTAHLHAPIVWAGIALGVAALLEIPALLLVGRLLPTRSPRVLVLLGCVAGVAYYALAGVVASPWLFVLLQPLNAWFFATVAGVGLTVFQDLFPSPGLASGLFTNTRRIGAVLAGLTIAAASALPDEYRAVYFAAAGLVLIVLVGAVLARSARPLGMEASGR